jgi:hypothetical protein
VYPGKPDPSFLIKERIVKKTFNKHYSLGALVLGAFALVGCLGGESANGPAAADGFGTLSVKVGTGTVSGASKSGLSKSATISLKKLVITFTSNATPVDVVIDTITVGEQGFSSDATIQQVIDSAYSLKALRTWYITAETFDVNDSLIHAKADTVVALLAGETRQVNLSLAPRFVMYKAKFNFPDSLASVTGPNKQKMNVTRLVMKVDGATVVDSSAAFASATPYTIGYDYVPVNVGTMVELLVIGNLEGWDRVTDTTLYAKTDIAISAVNPSVDSSRTVALNYVGPVTGLADLSVTIQKVGLFEVTATTDPVAVPKRK